MYVEDERFTNNIDKFGKGLAAFMRIAMRIYAKKIGNKYKRVAPCKCGATL
jgi:hypothetical protein